MMMETLAQELAPHRIRVNAVAPGAIKTPINRDAWDTPQAREDLLKLIPYNRIGEPDDIAHASSASAPTSWTTWSGPPSTSTAE